MTNQIASIKTRIANLTASINADRATERSLNPMSERAAKVALQAEIRTQTEELETLCSAVAKAESAAAGYPCAHLSRADRDVVEGY